MLQLVLKITIFAVLAVLNVWTTIIVLGEMHLRQVNSRPMTAPTWTRSLAEAR